MPMLINPSRKVFSSPRMSAGKLSIITCVLKKVSKSVISITTI